MTFEEVVDCEACGKEGESGNYDVELGWCCDECKDNIESDRFAAEEAAEEDEDDPDPEQVFRDELQMRQLEDEYTAGTL